MKINNFQNQEIKEIKLRLNKIEEYLYNHINSKLAVMETKLNQVIGQNKNKVSKYSSIVITVLSSLVVGLAVYLLTNN